MAVNVSGQNGGPNSSISNQQSAVIGGTFSTSIAATLPTGPINDLGQAVLGPTYSGGTTNRLKLTPAVGNTTVNSLDSSNVPDGFTVLITNESTTDMLIFTNLGGGLPVNQFLNQSNGSVSIPASGAARVTYVTPRWRFA